MAVYLITYDLSKPGQDYPDLIAAIKEYQNAKQITKSCYGIVSAATPDHIFAKLSPFLDKNDTLYVLTLGKGAVGQGLELTNTWIVKNAR